MVGHAARRGPHHCAQGAFTVVLKAHETREAMVAATVLLTASHPHQDPDMRGRREVDAKSEQRAAMAGRLMPTIGARVYQHY